MSVSANGSRRGGGGGAVVAMTIAISLTYGGGGGKQASINANEWWMETSATCWQMDSVYHREHSHI